MIETIVSKFQWFRKRLFRLFSYRAGATMDLIDALAATPTTDSVVKLSLSNLFGRTYSSITDVLSSLFRANLKIPPTDEEKTAQTLKITQLLAEEYASSALQKDLALFAIDCTANPRIFADKVKDRTMVHAPNHVPGQKPITVGHEYSVLVYLPDREEDKEKHWVVPLSVKRVESRQSGPKVGLLQLEEITNHTMFKSRFCISVTDAAYSTKDWVIGVDKWPHVIQIARVRGNRKFFRLPAPNSRTRRGRPQEYGEELVLQAPSEPDLEEVTTMVTRRGKECQVLLQRWNDVVMQGSKEERTHEHPFDLLKVTVTDKNGKAVYRRPLWVIIVGARRREVRSKDAHIAYGRRYDIEHYFRFGKQRLGMVGSQTCETRHEENWHWIGLLAYNMLYYARSLAKSTRYPWEKKKIQVLNSIERPSQVQRDYNRIISEIGTPAPFPKPRGKSPGRQLGHKIGERPDRPVIRKSAEKEDNESENLAKKQKKVIPERKKRNQPLKYSRMRRIWSKNRPPPIRC
jgi:DDE superfamily endonuclease